MLIIPDVETQYLQVFFGDSLYNQNEVIEPHPTIEFLILYRYKVNKNLKINAEESSTLLKLFKKEQTSNIVGTGNLNGA